MNEFPKKIDPYNPTSLIIQWNHGKTYLLSYLDLRSECPCAECVDENTGQRIVQKSNLHPGIHPLQIQWVGRYALQIEWSDGHDTGLYSFDRMLSLCQKYGQFEPKQLSIDLSAEKPLN